MGCITSTNVKPDTAEPGTPQQVQINIISASKTPSFCSSVSAEPQQRQQPSSSNPTASSCASPAVVDGLSSVAMARSVSGSEEFAEMTENSDELGKEEQSTKSTDKPCSAQKTKKEKTA